MKAAMMVIMTVMMVVKVGMIMIKDR